MFAYPWDLPPDVTPLVYARNAAGTEVTAHFWFKLFPKKFRMRDFPVDDALMEKLVNSVDPTGQLAPGPDLLSRFLKINGDMRRQEQPAARRSALQDGREDSVERPVHPLGQGRGRFRRCAQLHLSRQEGGSAGAPRLRLIRRRQHARAAPPTTDAWCGRRIWASTATASCWTTATRCNRSTGTCSQIDVKVGDMVKKGQTMGFAGQTGLAGGVHLHFSMQIDGVQIESAGVVGRALDSRPDSEQARSGKGGRGDGGGGSPSESLTQASALNRVRIGKDC